MPGPLPLTFVADLSDGRTGDLLAVSVSASGHGLALFVPPDDAKRATARVERGGGGSFAASQAKPPYDATFVEHDGRNLLRTVEISSVPLAFPTIQTLPGGEILVVAGRCRRHTDGTAEENAHVYDDAGLLQRAFTLGDGIEHVQATRSGEIWVGYFDEGVYGNYGWDDPIGRSGIVVFDTHGEITWRFSAPGGVGPIDDCYALNVGDAETWTCYYSDFPVVRVSGRSVQAWGNTITGAVGLAADRDRLLLAGGYSAHDRVVLATLANGPAADPPAGWVAQIAEFALRLPDGGPVRKPSVIGRGGTLHVFQGAEWYRVDVAEV